MNFVSVTFLVFFVGVFAAHWILPHRWRIPLLLVASYVFYGWWNWRFLSLVIASTLLDYYVGARIYVASTRGRKRAWLCVSLAGNLGILSYFKYANFFLDNLVVLANSVGWHLSQPALKIILPLGISFFSFQTLSYALDIYLEKLTPTRSLLQFATFVAFFPHLVAGPIVRARELLYQLEIPHVLRSDDFQQGLIRFLNGFVKKAFIADILAIHLVDPVFAHPERYAYGTLWLAMFGYGVQIYADFSGYSSMAIGTAQMLGYQFPENFLFPYLSRGFSEFWRRWHMTMSRFFRDYVYIALGGNRISRGRTLVNLAATTLISGLWHGANWTFVAWGGLHGVCIAGDHLIRELNPNPRPSRLRTFAGWAVTILLVHFAWILFRSASFDVAWLYLRHLFGAAGQGIEVPALVWVAFAGFFLDHAYGWLAEHHPAVPLAIPAPAWGVAYAALIIFMYHAVPRNPNPFIYFQF